VHTVSTTRAQFQQTAPQAGSEIPEGKCHQSAIPTTGIIIIIITLMLMTPLMPMVSIPL